MRDFLLFITVDFSVGFLILSILCGLEAQWGDCGRDDCLCCGDCYYIKNRANLAMIYGVCCAVMTFVSIKLATNA